MVHSSKICNPCGRSFIPPEYMTEEQAALTESCSHGCSSARTRGYSTGPGKKNVEGRGGESIGGLEFDHVCGCGECAALKATDRSALIAATAARLGMGIVPPGTPRPKLKPSDLARLAAKIRKARLETYDPIQTEEADGEGAAATHAIMSGGRRAGLGGGLS